MPWLDLGELPVSYNSSKSEAYQVYMIPSSVPPQSLVVQYKSWSACYDQKSAVQLYA